MKEWNFKHAKHFNVRFVIETEKIEANDKLAQVKQAWDMGAGIPEKEVMECIEMAMPGPHDKVLRNPQIAQAEQQQQMMDQQLHTQRAGGTATGKLLDDTIRRHQQHGAIQDAGQRTVLGDKFDELMHRQAVGKRLDGAMNGNGKA